MLNFYLKASWSFFLSSALRRWRTPTWMRWWSSERPSTQKSPLTLECRAQLSASTTSSQWCWKSVSRHRQRKPTPSTEKWAAPFSFARNSKLKSHARTCSRRPTETTGKMETPSPHIEDCFSRKCVETRNFCHAEQFLSANFWAHHARKCFVTWYTNNYLDLLGFFLLFVKLNCYSTSQKKKKEKP